MEWTRSETLALASHACVQCDGLGLRLSEREEPSQPCHCVLRAIFRACYTRFRDCAGKEKFLSRVTLHSTQGVDKKNTWSRKDEEYMADFCLVSRRFLTDEEYQIFKYHFLLGAEWKLCCRKLNMDRGTFFHTLYRLQQRLGRVFRELQPYALYPLSEYFHGESKPVTPQRLEISRVVPIRPPVVKPDINPPCTKVA
ncbi:MAG: hypothetical protein M3Z32_02325 [Acidobacteriota bacterium]|nr:hypothetical protein [Acidobacteriota bacterium]